jgi:hypothetical protein
MSATVAYVVLAICILALFAVGAAGWWMAREALAEEEHDDSHSANGAV